MTHDKYIGVGLGKKLFDFLYTWTSLEFIMKECCEISVEPSLKDVMEDGNYFHDKTEANQASFVQITVSDEKPSISTLKLIMSQKGHTTNLKTVPFFERNIVVANDIFY